MSKYTEAERRKIKYLMERPRLTFKPNPFQRKLISSLSKQTFAIAANRIGKSYGSAYILSCHLTGWYPKDWEGPKFDHPISAGVLSVATKQIQDGLQAHLTGTIRQGSIEEGKLLHPTEIVRAQGTSGSPGTLSRLEVKHISGGISNLVVGTYKARADVIQGSSRDFMLLDEEPSPDGENIYREAKTRLMTGAGGKGGYLLAVYTPTKGLSALTYKVYNNTPEGINLIKGTMEDCNHLSEQAKAELIKGCSPAEIALITKGIPMMGTGAIYPFEPETYTCADFQIPDHWPRIAGVDFGYGDSAVVAIAKDPEAETYYIYQAAPYKEVPASELASQIKQTLGDIPVAWPHDGLMRRTEAGTYLNLFKAEGANMVARQFTNPGTNNNGVEVGLTLMRKYFAEGKIQVFNSCTHLLAELSAYRYKKAGVVNKEHDHCCDAFRYGLLSLDRYGVPVGTPKNKHADVDWGAGFPSAEGVWQ